MKEKFTIGQLADLFNINVQTLYYYDKVGLLVPYSRNSMTGLRIYSLNQVHQLSSILYLKRCGFNLKTIKEMNKILTPQIVKEKLTEKNEEIKKQWEEIMRINTASKKKLKYIDDERNNQEIENNKIVYRKRRYFLKTGSEEIAYRTEYLDYYPVVVAYFGVEKVFGALLEKDNEIESDINKLSIIPNGNYFVSYHLGSYPSINDHKKRIMKENPDLEFSEDMYTFDIIDQMNSSDPKEYLTKLELQIKT
ncbi:MAG: MerR family transcriptional regulator [Sphaerochaetaceae bacterium]